MKHILFIFCIVRQHNKLNVCYIALCNWMAICIALQEGVLQNEICLIKVPLSETTRKLNTQANNQSWKASKVAIQHLHFSQPKLHKNKEKDTNIMFFCLVLLLVWKVYFSLLLFYLFNKCVFKSSKILICKTNDFKHYIQRLLQLHFHFLKGSTN